MSHMHCQSGALHPVFAAPALVVAGSAAPPWPPSTAEKMREGLAAAVTPEPPARSANKGSGSRADRRTVACRLCRRRGFLVQYQQKV